MDQLDQSKVDLAFNVLNAIHTALTESNVKNAEFLAALKTITELVEGEETEGGEG